MSDPLQPAEHDLHITKKMIDITNKYGVHVVVSTKSDTMYDCNFTPLYASFQLSVSNADNRKDIEPNVPDIGSRIKFFNELKREGFRVGIRIQPFIPGITSEEIIDIFRDADNFTIEGIKLVPQNKEQKLKCLDMFHLSSSDFTQMGLLNLKPEIRLKAYAPLIRKLQQLGIPYSIADNDLHYIGTNRCCCGDTLIRQSTTFNNTALLKMYGLDYRIEDVERELDEFCVRDCVCNQLFTSNRQEGCKTVYDFYQKRFGRKSSPFSPKFLYTTEEEQLSIF